MHLIYYEEENVEEDEKVFVKAGKLKLLVTLYYINNEYLLKYASEKINVH